ncbi:hypothetical protein HPT27_12285 [Permianibacter sp. IMCC34836]|uniref:hypothetical protein n=1 Tax=Permianibacter fluminis TaxID=2738515 RepID=UPI0015516DEB|nr:hypothetical protein [Permianibacter fluminis]NQD37806.1 hypothetical protein [Permianibacter fluminis]
MEKLLGQLAVSAVAGVVMATSGGCGVLMLQGSDAVCGLGWVWLFAIPTAVIFSILLGLPTLLLFKRVGFQRWWHYMLGGALIAAPFWYSLAGPFDSARWHHASLYDSINYLGSGAMAGLALWLAEFEFAKRQSARPK